MATTFIVSDPNGDAPTEADVDTGRASAPAARPFMAVPAGTTNVVPAPVVANDYGTATQMASRPLTHTRSFSTTVTVDLGLTVSG